MRSVVVSMCVSYECSLTVSAALALSGAFRISLLRMWPAQFAMGPGFFWLLPVFMAGTGATDPVRIRMFEASVRSVFPRSSSQA